jgi:hypothetical protein
VGCAEVARQIRASRHGRLIGVRGRLQELPQPAGQCPQVERADVGVGVEVGRPTQLDTGAMRDLVCLEVKRVEPLRQRRQPGGLQLGPALGILLVGLQHRRHPVRDRLAADLDLDCRLQLGHPCVEPPGGRAEMAVERELVQVAQPRPLLPLARPGAQLADPLDRVRLEQRLVPLVDRLHRQVRLVPRPLQVVLAVDLLQEPLGLAAVFVEIPGQGADDIRGPLATMDR